MSSYTFNDVLIKPKYSEIESRKGVGLSTQLGNIKLKLPIISANMKTITGPTMAGTMNKHGGFGILHRFCTIEDNVQMFKDAMDEIEFPMCTSSRLMKTERQSSCAVSIGIHDIDKLRFECLYRAGAKVFCIDVAHGHHVLVKNMLTWIQDQLSNSDERNEITLIAGNVATGEAAKDLYNWGADVIKVGIGPGAMCCTRENTGVGVPQLYALEEIRNSLVNLGHIGNRVPIIADGGVKTVGDIAKALKFADAVMVGSFIAGTTETPGNVFKGPDKQFYKVYGGSASGENKGENNFVEGMTATVPFRGKVKYILKEIREGLQSACSYVGAHNLSEFKEKCEFIPITGAGRTESKI